MNGARLRKTLLFLLVQAALLGVVLEVGLRLLKPHHDGVRALLYRAAMETDFDALDELPELLAATPLGYRPLRVESGYVLNSRSFRTVEYEMAKPAGVYRVLAIGDSFTYGVVPDADHWTTFLERGLEARLGRPVQVLRLGVPGTGTPFQLRLWQLEGRHLDADLVVLGFFVGNDFFDDLGMKPGAEGLWAKALTVSYALRLIHNLGRLGRLGSEREVLEDDGEKRTAGGYELPGFAEGFDESRPTMLPELYAEIEAERMALCLTAERLKFDLRFDRIAGLLERFAWEVETAGVPFVVMVIPDELQVDPEVRAAALAHAGRPLEDYDLDLPQRRLAAFFEERGIAYLDLLPNFEHRARRERLYLVRDSHWNRAGNALAARLLLQRLKTSPQS